MKAWTKFLVPAKNRIKVTLKYWWLTPVVISAVLVESAFSAREAMAYTLMGGFALQGLMSYSQIWESGDLADKKSVYILRLAVCFGVGALSGLAVAPAWPN